MVSFDDDEMKTLMSAAEVVPIERRSEFLNSVATLLMSNPADRAAVVAKVQRSFLAMPASDCCTGSCNDRWAGD
jgi:hypothetical protein